ncbi:MAG: lipopolysaccharide heptosyltransferase I [Burkholderiaceae bacterium]|jgi:heptosyltransferase-1|nr:lipopolysaccharide heptosyltransferase I [Burkholderiaceae bacterium]
MSSARILIVKTSSMGDIVHALPLVSDIATHLPDARIEWVAEEGFAAIARLHPSVTRVVTVALRRWRRRLFAGQTWDELRAAKQQLRDLPYDRVIDCQGLLKSAWIARWSRGPRTGPDRHSAREPIAAAFYDQKVAVAHQMHAVERNRRLGAAAFGYAIDTPARYGLRVPRVTPGLVPTDRRYAVLLTNASRPTKLWGDDRWRALEAQLAAQGLRSLLFWGSPAERVATEQRAAAMRDARVLPRVSLDVAAAVLAGATVVVGLDTGLSHLAAAVGAPTVGIYCDYDPALVGLVGDARCESLGGVSAAPSAQAVIDAAARVMGHALG